MEVPGPARFEELRVGDERILEHRLTQSDVDTFAALTGDTNPLHLDAAFARRAGFSAPVVHGMLSASFLSTMIGTLLPGPGALWTSQTIEFSSPAYVGDTLRVTARVKQRSAAVRSVVLALEVTNQSGRRVLSGEATVRVPTDPGEDRSVPDVANRPAVLVSGATGSIGGAIARALAGDGHPILALYRYAEEEAERLVAEIRAAGGTALALCADLSGDGDVGSLVSRGEAELGPILGLVHCAAPGLSLRSFEELDWAGVEEQLAVHVGGAFRCTKAVLPRMLEAGGGAIVLLSSTAADAVPPTRQTHYVTAKAALSALARCIAAELGPRGIRVNVVSPGLTESKLTAGLPEKARMVTRMQTPLRRLAVPGDAVGAVRFLLSPAAGHVTGQTIRVDGGAVME